MPKGMIEVPDVDMDASAPADADVDSSDDEEMSLDASYKARRRPSVCAGSRAPGISDKELRFVLDRTLRAARGRLRASGSGLANADRGERRGARGGITDAERTRSCAR